MYFWLHQLLSFSLLKLPFTISLTFQIPSKQKFKPFELAAGKHYLKRINQAQMKEMLLEHGATVVAAHGAMVAVVWFAEVGVMAEDGAMAEAAG